MILRCRKSRRDADSRLSSDDRNGVETVWVHFPKKYTGGRATLAYWAATSPGLEVRTEENRPRQNAYLGATSAKSNLPPRYGWAHRKKRLVDTVSFGHWVTSRIPMSLYYNNLRRHTSSLVERPTLDLKLTFASKFFLLLVTIFLSFATIHLLTNKKFSKKFSTTALPQGSKSVYTKDCENYFKKCWIW